MGFAYHASGLTDIQLLALQGARKPDTKGIVIQANPI